MKWLEIFGMIFAASGFGLISIGFLKIGFGLGLLSCCMLIPLFLSKNLYYMLTLQAYFAIMNIIGIERLL